MRVNPNPLPDLLAALDQNQQQLNNDEQQIASGRSVNFPSDNPAAAAGLVQNADQTSRADQFLRSIGSIQGEMQSADSTLSSVITTLQRAISLGVEGANGTLSAADRAAIASEVTGIQSQLLNLANLSYQGNYVFAGTATQTAPYVIDSTSSSGVTYKGNANVNQVTLGNHFTLQTNLPGSQLFTSPGNDMFQAIQDLLTTLQAGKTSDIGAAVTEVSNAYHYIDTARVFYGNGENQLDSQQTYLNNETTQLAQQQTNLGGADMAAVLTNLATTQTSRQATLAAMARIGQSNLFDYLK
jgi:flagellar hook-associated protein 3 FlgL